MSVREDICSDLLTALRGMRSGSGYHYDWDSVYRWRAPETPPTFPAAMMLDISETVSQVVYPIHDRVLTLELHGVHAVEYTTDDDPGEAGSRMLSDLERAVMQDVTRGGVAVDTKLVRSEKLVDFPAESLVLVVLVVEVTYRTSLTDPQGSV